MAEFNYYGLIIASALLVLYFISRFYAKKAEINDDDFFNCYLIALIGAFFGSRIWHLMTDWQLYQGNWTEMLKIWQGGLSIIGAVGGALLLLFFYIMWVYQPANCLKIKLKDRLIFFKKVLDSVAFALPIAQAIGRLANFFNQELYGYPSQLPWAIYIEPANRLPGYLDQAYYHPLFAYEGLLLLLFAVLIRCWKKPLGSGDYFLGYLGYYAVIRFFLDFLRIDKYTSGKTGLGLNQFFLLSVLMMIVFYQLINYYRYLISQAKRTKQSQKR